MGRASFISKIIVFKSDHICSQKQILYSAEGESLAMAAHTLGLTDVRKSAPRRGEHGVKACLTERRPGEDGGGGMTKTPLRNCPLPSLYSLCLGVLALHLDELIEYGEHVLPLLPSDAKLSLLAAARKRNELTNSALKLLIDSSMAVLDVHSTTPKISASAILSAARIMSPILRCIDITGCVISPRFLISLAEAAPLLQVVRFGGVQDRPVQDPEAMSEAVLRILPKLEQASDVVDSWEEEKDSSPMSILSSGRLMHLRCLSWPEMPHETKVLCQSASPQVCINPSTEEVLARKLPIEFDSNGNDLDGEYLQRVAGYEKWNNLEEKSNRTGTSTAVVHIAERFRLAYASQEKRLKKKDERLWRKATREVLSTSGGERAINEWEHGF